MCCFIFTRRDRSLVKNQPKNPCHLNWFKAGCLVTWFLRALNTFASSSVDVFELIIGKKSISVVLEVSRIFGQSHEMNKLFHIFFVIFLRFFSHVFFWATFRDFVILEWNIVILIHLFLFRGVIGCNHKDQKMSIFKKVLLGWYLIWRKVSERINPDYDYITIYIYISENHISGKLGPLGYPSKKQISSDAMAEILCRIAAQRDQVPMAGKNMPVLSRESRSTFVGFQNNKKLKPVNFANL